MRTFRARAATGTSPNRSEPAWEDIDRVSGHNGVAGRDLATLGRQPWQEKVRMLNTLIDGWISEDDMRAIEKILRSVPSAAEMSIIRAEMAKRELDFSDLGQRTRFGAWLARNP